MKSSYDHSDTGNAELLNDLFGEDIRYDAITQRWLQWRNTHRWYELEESLQTRLAIRTANHRFDLAKEFDTESARSEVSFAIQSKNLSRIVNMLSIARHLPPIGNTGIVWDNKPNLLAVNNGVIDLSTGKFRTGQRHDFLSQGLNINYSSSAQAPTWMKFLNDITLGNQELINFLWRAIGYTLTGFTYEQVFFMLYGSGSNGKSTLTDILGILLKGFSRTVRFSAFEENAVGDSARDLAELPGIRAAFASESSEFRSLNTSIIKYITGGAPISTSKKYGQPFTFTPQFKLWLDTNHLPKVNDDSYGFWRRIVLIPFDAKFTEGQNRDNLMEQKLLGELPGILSWAVQGAKLWIDNKLNVPPSLLLKVVQYRESEDEIEQFMEERCTKEVNDVCPASLLYLYFKAWCDERQIRCMSATAFGRRLEGKFTKIHTRTGWVYQGIGLRPPQI